MMSTPSIRTPSAALVTSTVFAAGSLSYAATESLYFRSLLNAPQDVAGNDLFQELWTALLPGGIGMSGLTNGGAAAAGAWAWRHAPRGSLHRTLAGWGAIAAAVHFAWVPAIATIIERMINHPVDSRRDMRRWLKLHHLRMAVSNATALGLFVAAWFV